MFFAPAAKARKAGLYMLLALAAYFGCLICGFAALLLCSFDFSFFKAVALNARQQRIKVV
ncbi:MAG: hypothetical protein KA084_00340 [Brachymonas sp.]|nr:hypothetical protein [Brachymonas sp.]MBP6967201.1 hypothetical protein [Brachymonas sp.]MBP7247122.1 hypothetical protein [Brachymonas sp.]MBP7724810.1 hypothetical protein [Brachymonas sp.]MBP7733828.1 hypothetical protein [Brachymonas sp.]